MFFFIISYKRKRCKICLNIGKIPIFLILYSFDISDMTEYDYFGPSYICCNPICFVWFKFLIFGKMAYFKRYTLCLL